MIDDVSAGQGPLLNGVSSVLLRAELERRQQDDESQKPECGSGAKGSYNMPAHVFALFLILILSTIACAFPLLSRRLSNGSSKQSTRGRLLFLSQHFGTGVLIATAFVHLLPTAFMSLTDACLPWIWNKGYRPMAGLIAMVAALIVVGVEMFLTTRGAGHSHSHHAPWKEHDEHEHEAVGLNGAVKAAKGQDSSRQGRLGIQRPTDLEDVALGDMETEGLVNGVSPLPVSTPNTANGNSKYHDEDEDNDSDLDLGLDELDPVDEAPSLLHRGGGDGAAEFETQESQPTGPSAQDQQKRLLLQCLLLEAGILFHSVFIGMAISVATGSSFAVFLIAITCHQCFEGLALGSRIAAINFHKHSPKPWLMVLAYGTTTPIGQAIGLFVHNMYDPQSQTGLLMVGIMNAISSGLLLFAGLVQLLAEDFLTEKSYKVLKGRRRLDAYLAVIAGATLMALVGAWA